MPETGSTSSDLRSIAPGEQPVRHATQRIRAAAERGKRSHGLAVQATYLLLRSRHPDDRRVGGLAALAVGTGRLAERCRIREYIEQVILDLEREPDRGGETGERLLEPWLERRHAGRPHHDTGADESAGLQRMHLLDLTDGELAALGLEVDRLSARHPETADRARKQFDQAHADGGIARQRRVAGKQLERQGLKRISDEQRGRLIVRPMTRRSAPPQIVIVHRGQVIVYEGINMHQLERAGGGLYLLLSEPQRTRRGKKQDRTYPLATAKHAVTHRSVKSLRRLVGARQSCRQRRLHAGAPGFQLTCERVRHGWHAHYPPGGLRA